MLSYLCWILLIIACDTINKTKPVDLYAVPNQTKKTNTQQNNTQPMAYNYGRGFFDIVDSVTFNYNDDSYEDFILVCKRKDSKKLNYNERTKRFFFIYQGTQHGPKLKFRDEQVIAEYMNRINGKCHHSYDSIYTVDNNIVRIEYSGSLNDNSGISFEWAIEQEWLATPDSISRTSPDILRFVNNKCIYQSYRIADSINSFTKKIIVGPKKDFIYHTLFYKSDHQISFKYLPVYELVSYDYLDTADNNLDLIDTFSVINSEGVSYVNSDSSLFSSFTRKIISKNNLDKVSVILGKIDMGSIIQLSDTSKISDLNSWISEEYQIPAFAGSSCEGAIGYRWHNAEIDKKPGIWLQNKNSFYQTYYPHKKEISFGTSEYLLENCIYYKSDSVEFLYCSPDSSSYTFGYTHMPSLAMLYVNKKLIHIGNDYSTTNVDGKSYWDYASHQLKSIYKIRDITFYEFSAGYVIGNKGKNWFKEYLPADEELFGCQAD